MTRLFWGLVIVELLVGTSVCHAVDAGRLWLPKKFQSARPALLAVAERAQSSHRCEQVLAGKMIPDRNTAQSYYFVITCRDDQRRSYTISYLYPIAGGDARVVSEQHPVGSSGKAAAAETSEGINAEQALGLCKKGFASASSGLDDATLVADAPLQEVSREEGFYVAMPFTSQSELGNRVLYRADCQVGSDGETHFDLVLQSPGALAICRDQLRSEAALLGRVTVVEDAIEELAADSGFHFMIPFDARALNSRAVRYLGDCKVKADGDSEVSLNLQAQGAVALCKDALAMETLLMKAVSVAEEPAAVAPDDSGFAVELAFDANDPDGNARKFRAYCRVDGDGEASVETALDKSAIIAVCTNGVIHETRNMLGVRVLEQQIPPLQQDEQGLLGIIPFDARDPGGRALHYQGECRVDDSGRTRIDIKPRRD